MQRLKIWPLVFGVLLCAICVGNVSAQVTKKANVKPNSRRIALVNVGVVDDVAMEQIRKHMEQYLEVRVQAIKAEPDDTADLLIQLRSWKKLMTTDDIAFVAIVNSTTDVREYLLVAPDHRWAMVIANAVLPENGDSQKHLWRLQKLCMRSAGFLFGMGFSPNARSVMASYRSLDELDRMGINFDPPGQGEFSRLAREAGLAHYVAFEGRKKRSRLAPDEQAPAAK